MSWKSRTLIGAAAVAALVAGSAAPAFAAADPAVPADCGVNASAYSDAGVPTHYGYENGATSVTTTKELALTFKPTAWVNIGGSGDTTYPQVFKSGNFAISPDGTLNFVRTTGQQLSQRKWNYTITTTAASTGWTGVRGLTVGYPYLYALTANGLDRYTYSSDGAAPVAAGTVATTGFATVANLSYDREITLASGGSADVLLATDSSTGALIEITVPQDAPGSWTRTTLKSTGFANITSLNTGWCASGGRPLLGIESDGDAFVWWDPNSTDGSGADLRGGTTRVASKWKLTAFSQ